jgi:hypothetical protein
MGMMRIQVPPIFIFYKGMSWDIPYEAGLSLGDFQKPATYREGVNTIGQTP